MKQEICVRPDQLERLFFADRIAAGDKFGDVAADAVGLVKELLTFQHLGIANVTASRHSKITGIKLEQFKELGARFDCVVRGRATMRGGKAFVLRFRAVAVRVRVDRGGNSHVFLECVRCLLRNCRLPRLPSKSTEHNMFELVAPYLVRPTGNAITVAVMRIGVFQDVGFRDGFEQSHSDDGWSDARRQRGIRGGDPSLTYPVDVKLELSGDRRVQIVQMNDGRGEPPPVFRCVIIPSETFSARLRTPELPFITADHNTLITELRREPNDLILTKLGDWAAGLIYVPSLRDIVTIGELNANIRLLDRSSIPAFINKI